ncbi:hypothetical protein [Sphingosinicella sp. YJ22]|uniref:hypothetical protein n=1 Tax=Sphingosinicella sp. YJ22 TaxID=1104780 RepID=UPI00140B7379|nr:hypothetical protein [Sphingosinicella sp. YJ22]
MRRTALGLAGLALAGCQPPAPAWPSELEAQAGLCSAVHVIRLRERDSATPPGSFDAFLQILHYAMIASARGRERIELRALDSVSRRAGVAQVELREQDWQARVADCAAAFPEARRPAGRLPEAPFEAGMICFGLADFVARTAADFPREAVAASDLAERALAAAAPELTRQARTNDEAERLGERYRVRAFLAGTPSSLLDQCAQRFPVRAG